MYTKKAIVGLILMAALILFAACNSYADPLSVSVTIPKATVLSVPVVLDKNTIQPAESLTISMQSNAFLSLSVFGPYKEGVPEKPLQLFESKAHIIFEDLQFEHDERYVYTVI